MKLKHIDHGFYRISAAKVKQLCGGRMPRHGYERLVEYQGTKCWVARTPVKGRMLWSIRNAEHHGRLREE